ncbi:MAG TPA: hypothetical protein VLV88_00015 [Terriglobales bacterium]|nr:hypothetical protein [Terriglobales bacterium]
MEEYKVYEAVLGLMDHIPKEDPHVTILNRTLNSKCGDDNPVLANGCSFLWVKPQSAKDVKRLLSSEWSDMDKSTWPDFQTKNAESVALHDPLQTPWKHKFQGEGIDLPKEWESPDLTIFLSRVGFNERKSEAVVYVLVFSYMDQVSTAGDYFLFRLDRQSLWIPSGRVTYFSKDKDQQESP